MGSHFAKLIAQNHVLQAFEPSLVDLLLAVPTRETEDGKITKIERMKEKSINFYFGRDKSG
jgi:hypothetical protein